MAKKQSAASIAPAAPRKASVAPESAAVPTVEVALPAVPATGADAAAPARAVTHDMIAQRAYELYQQGAPGSPDDHWWQAERELRGR